MIQALLIISGLLQFISIAPYLVDTAKGRSKPRLVSWFNWTLLTGIATAAALSQHQYASAILTGSETITQLCVVLLGFRNGDHSIERLDIICQIGAVCGLVLWIIFNNPLVAIIATVLIDFIVAIPTYVHAWQKPNEETGSTYLLSGLGALAAVFAVTTRTILGYTFPAYLTFSNGFTFALIKLSRNQAKTLA